MSDTDKLTKEQLEERRRGFEAGKAARKRAGGWPQAAVDAEKQRFDERRDEVYDLALQFYEGFKAGAGRKD